MGFCYVYAQHVASLYFRQIIMQEIVKTKVKYGVTFLAIARHFLKGRVCWKAVNEIVNELEPII